MSIFTDAGSSDLDKKARDIFGDQVTVLQIQYQAFWVPGTDSSEVRQP